MAIDRALLPEIPLASQFRATLDHVLPYAVEGNVDSIDLDGIHCKGVPVPIGSICEVQRAGQSAIEVVVVQVSQGGTVMIRPVDSGEIPNGIQIGDRVRLKRTIATVHVGAHLLGCVLDARGQPYIGTCHGGFGVRIPLDRPNTTYIDRPPIEGLLRTGIAQIDEFLAVGKGQRALWLCSEEMQAADLITQLLVHAEVDCTVVVQVRSTEKDRIAPVQERFRLNSSSVWTAIVVSPESSGDEKSLAARSATAVAEYFRDRGKDVLLLLDLTGFDATAIESIRGGGSSKAKQSLLQQVCGRIGRNRRGSISGFIMLRMEDALRLSDKELEEQFDCQIWFEDQVAGKNSTWSIDRVRSKNRLPLKLAKSLIGRESLGKQIQNRP